MDLAILHKLYWTRIAMVTSNYNQIMHSLIPTMVRYHNETKIQMLVPHYCRDQWLHCLTASWCHNLCFSDFCCIARSLRVAAMVFGTTYCFKFQLVKAMLARIVCKCCSSNGIPTAFPTFYSRTVILIWHHGSRESHQSKNLKLIVQLGMIITLRGGSIVSLIRASWPSENVSCKLVIMSSMIGMGNYIITHGYLF